MNYTDEELARLVDEHRRFQIEIAELRTELAAARLRALPASVSDGVVARAIQHALILEAASRRH